MVDPQSDIQIYLGEQAATGMRIRYVIDTHVHADHLSGGRELARVTGAEYVLHASAPAQYPFYPVNDSDVLDMGNVVVRIIHTPGHTPEHMSLAVTDRSRGPEEWFLLTGHMLMVGDLGRTELATDAETGARALWRSARRLLELPDTLEVFPGAFAGSVCGRALSGKPSSTLGFERRFNKALRFANEDEFVAYMLQNIPERPARAAEIRAANLGVLEKVGE